MIIKPLKELSNLEILIFQFLVIIMLSYHKESYDSYKKFALQMFQI